MRACFSGELWWASSCSPPIDIGGSLFPLLIACMSLTLCLVMRLYFMHRFVFWYWRRWCVQGEDGTSQSVEAYAAFSRKRIKGLGERGMVKDRGAWTACRMLGGDGIRSRLRDRSFYVTQGSLHSIDRCQIAEDSCRGNMSFSGVILSTWARTALYCQYTSSTVVVNTSSRRRREGVQAHKYTQDTGTQRGTMRKLGKKWREKPEAGSLRISFPFPVFLLVNL